MLKKIVKYGNSNAIVLDKAILELLNMQEGSIVKLTTDGKSLMITPITPENKSSVCENYTFENALQETLWKNWSVGFENPEQALDYQKEFRALAEDLMSNEEYKKKCLALQEKHKDLQSVEYQEESKKLLKKFSPRMAKISQYLAAKALKGAQSTKYNQMQSEMESIFSKEFKNLIPLINQASNNSEFIHESQLLSEEFKDKKDSKEFLEKYSQLLYKYVPQLETIHKELREVSEKFNS